MSDRAPDNQPTENIRTVLKNERESLNRWIEQHAAERRSVSRSESIINRQRETVQQLERQLAIRLAEGEQPQEVTGL